MSSFRICRNCVLDNVEVPGIVFSPAGVCNFCLTWAERESERRIEATNLPWVLDGIRKRGKGKKYDVLLGLSGGVDSSACLDFLIDNDVRPLCWSMDNGYNDPRADENIMRLVEKLRVPFIRQVLDLDQFRDLQKAFIQSGTKNIEIPTDHILLAAGYRMAAKHGITTIISGGNHATEGIMPGSYGYDAKDLTFIKDVNRKHGDKKLDKLPLISMAEYLYYRFFKRIKTVNILDYTEYNREQSIRVLEDKYGWKTYGEKHGENYFTLWFQNYWLLIKWKLDKRKPHYSSLINSRQMTQNTAVHKLLEKLEHPAFGMEGTALKVPKRDYTESRNVEWLWNLLHKIYAVLKKFD